MSIKIGIGRIILSGGGGGGSSAVNGAPSALVLTALTDVSIQLNWTIGSTNQDGHFIERSPDGSTWTYINTVLGAVATFTNTGLTEDTRYYYRVRAFKGTSYSAYTSAANTYTYYGFTLTATGTGLGVATLYHLYSNAIQTLRLTGVAKFYSDAAGTLNESTTYDLAVGVNSRYIRCASGTARLYVKVRNITQWSAADGDGWVSITNAPRIDGDISKMTAMTGIYVAGLNNLSGSLAAMTQLTYVRIGGSNTVTGAITNLTALTLLYMYGNNTISGDLGSANMVNGITFLIINPTSGQLTYTAGAVWSNATITILPGVGKGLTATEIDNMLIDMAASPSLIGKTITLNGNNAARTAASNAAKATLEGVGRTCTVLTN